MSDTPIDFRYPHMAAAALAGNWQRFESFSTSMRLTARHCIVYTHNRDSELLDQVNAEVIAAALEPFKNAVDFKANHWACGWVAGYAIRVYNCDDSITQAFREYCDLMANLQDYACLDDDMLCTREQDTHDAGECGEHCHVCEVEREAEYEASK